MKYKYLVVVFLLLGLVSCKPVWETRTPKFAEDVKAVVNPNELQKWALNEIKNKPPNTGDMERISEDRIPTYIRNLSSQGSPFEFAIYKKASSETEDSVELYWGGGFGHWGIRVGSPTFRPEGGDYFIKWKPGIYFWHETRYGYQQPGGVP